MDVRIIHFYPDLMSLYGSYANVAILRRYLEGLGNTVSVETVRPGETARLSGADFFFMGAGTERAAQAAMGDFARFGPELKAAASNGSVMLFAGTAMDLLGQTVTEADGAVWQGIGLADFSTVYSKLRTVEDVYGYTDLYAGPVVGFINKCSVTRGVNTPLLSRVEFGCGNDGTGLPEGFHRDNVFASQLTGPLLVKNPGMLKAVAAAICRQRGKPLPENAPADEWAERGYAATVEQLRRRYRIQ